MKYLTLLILPVLLVGCGDYGQYAQAVKEQNITMQIRAEASARAKEERRAVHQEKMMRYAANALSAAASSPDKADDVTVPLILMVLEDKWAVVETMAAANEQPAALQAIEAPETAGEFVQKSGSVILGVTGTVATAYTSSKNTDAWAAAAANAGTAYYISGEHNTVTHDSNKSGSQNNVVSSGDSTITGGTANDQSNNCSSGNCDGEDDGGDTDLGMCTGDRPSVPIIRKDDDGTTWVSATCSCTSYQDGVCDA